VCSSFPDLPFQAGEHPSVGRPGGRPRSQDGRRSGQGSLGDLSVCISCCANLTCIVSLQRYLCSKHLNFSPEKRVAGSSLASKRFFSMPANVRMRICCFAQWQLFSCVRRSCGPDATRCATRLARDRSLLSSLHRNCTGARHPLRSLAGESMSSWAFLPGVCIRASSGSSFTPLNDLQMQPVLFRTRTSSTPPKALPPALDRASEKHAIAILCLRGLGYSIRSAPLAPRKARRKTKPMSRDDHNPGRGQTRRVIRDKTIPRSQLPRSLARLRHRRL
jgi:hypothetical protein